MTQIVCKDTHKRRDYKIKLHLFTFIQLINRSFVYQEVKGVKEVKELRRMSCCLKNYAKKTVVLTPQRP